MWLLQRFRASKSQFHTKTQIFAPLFAVFLIIGSIHCIFFCISVSKINLNQGSSESSAKAVNFPSWALYNVYNYSVLIELQHKAAFFSIWKDDISITAVFGQIKEKASKLLLVSTYNESFLQPEFKHKPTPSQGQGSCTAKVNPVYELRKLRNSWVSTISLVGVITDISHLRPLLSWLIL